MTSQINITFIILKYLSTDFQLWYSSKINDYWNKMIALLINY